jgi:anionic cell wall polymer biosynthesis LytR-Cps2A-Psr (LCP) family protein
MDNFKKRRYLLVVIYIGCTVLAMVGLWRIQNKANLALSKQSDELSTFLEQRKADRISVDGETDVFGEDGIVRILVIGLDSRVGEKQGHCDAIQFVEINKQNSSVRITAVPRGTFARLPGSGHKPSDYYLSNACAIGGLQYGISEIERVTNINADYLVVVGFSEVIGILRHLKLPTTETLQFLRQRQGYAIGEPQRAHNHSTFLKHLLVNYLPKDTSAIDIPFQYLLYSLTRTDMNFSEARDLYADLVAMKLSDKPDQVQLQMRPAYAVANIPYDPATVGNYVDGIVSAISPYLSEEAYSGNNLEEVQKKLLEVVDKNIEDADFLKWAYENQLWLQIEDGEDRENTHYRIVKKYAEQLDDKDLSATVVSDYILEMEYLKLNDWAQKGQELLKIFLE